jgi:hypothetical protein
MLAPIVVVLICILTNSVQELLFPCILGSIVVVCVLDNTTLTGVRWKHNVVLIYISLMARDVENFSICFGVICTSFFKMSVLFICLFVHLVIDSLGV